MVSNRLDVGSEKDSEETEITVGSWWEVHARVVWKTKIRKMSSFMP